ncbi:Cellulase (glycosyl hydrolase family 5) [Draconibacterium orientale]|uniref:Cellulase (Glycosyl hydrolase family 5) n=1 Tax=Draconibacterium orientale TaxID=1168034 RepID=X5DHQ3_9BACT|nr:cellulase family glycosylhydrolase [Draconibacterium orientale]AHW60619.1 glycoside hydrolase [Draconibacterium orientale]SET05491.1 Cellulase (glycosyl hydrolase family 5) [Draconibacterium orientale]
MKLISIKVLGVMLISIWALSSSAQSFLHTEGQDMVNEEGKKVFLRGVGLGNWMLPEGYMWKFGKYGDRPRNIEKIVAAHIGQEKADEFWKEYRKNYITEADIKRIAELGYNSVRPALNSRLFITEGQNNEFIDEGFELLDNLVKWCKKYHLYVIIDMHGAPGGQTGQNIDDSPNDLPELFMNPKNEELLVKLWVKIAERYKEEPIVAAYDLLNEPLPERTGAAEKHKHQLVPLYKKLITEIRKVDKKHMFTLEGYNWSNNWSEFTEALDDNMFFQFHFYNWDRPDHLKDISYFLKKREELNTPVWVGETGEKNNTLYFSTSQLFSTTNIGWSFWPWKKMDTENTPYSIKSPEGWQEVAAYSRRGENVTAKNPEKIFNQLLENIKIENCVYFPDVVNAMFCRIPLKIEAENYGHKGYLKSYFVKDTATMSANYRREEPVKVEVINSNKQSLISDQAIHLSEGEWTAYNFVSLQEKQYKMSFEIKTVGTADIVLRINGNRITKQVNASEWTEIELDPQVFTAGENELKVEVETGDIQLNWINIY